MPTQVRQSKVSTGKAVQSDDELDLTPMSKKNPPFPPPNHPESGDGEGEPDEIYGKELVCVCTCVCVCVCLCCVHMFMYVYV